jgi:hypothetical protein
MEVAGYVDDFNCEQKLQACMFYFQLLHKASFLRFVLQIEIKCVCGRQLQGICIALSLKIMSSI